ncbi:MAG: glycosyltransferase [Lachnospiraceae bacterium]
MKILFTCGTLMHGGAERVISVLSNELALLGHEVEILLYYKSKVWYELNEQVHVKTDPPGNVVKHILFRHNFFSKSKADIIISFLAPVNMVSIVSNMGTGKKLVVADRSDPRYAPKKFLLRQIRNILYRFADGAVFQSKNNQEYFSNYVQKKSTVIYNPVDVGKYKRIALKTQRKDKIVVVGRLIPSKNPFMILDAFLEILKDFPTYELSFYGDGSLREEIRIKAAEMGISDKVNTFGAVKNVFECIMDAKLYVLTSNYEGMPNSLIEAMCVGIPVISTKVSGAVDLIENDKNGRLIESTDTKGLISAISDLLSDYDTAIKYAEKAARLNEELDSKRIAASWVSYIDKVCNK